MRLDASTTQLSTETESRNHKVGLPRTPQRELARMALAARALWRRQLQLQQVFGNQLQVLLFCAPELSNGCIEWWNGNVVIVKVCTFQMSNVVFHTRSRLINCCLRLRNIIEERPSRPYTK